MTKRKMRTNEPNGIRSNADDCTEMFRSDRPLTDADRSRWRDCRPIRPNAKGTQQIERRFLIRTIYFEGVFRHAQGDFMFIPKSIRLNDVNMLDFIWKLFLAMFDVLDVLLSLALFRTTHLKNFENVFTVFPGALSHIDDESESRFAIRRAENDEELVLRSTSVVLLDRC